MLQIHVWGHPGSKTLPRGPQDAPRGPKRPRWKPPLLTQRSGEHLCAAWVVDPRRSIFLGLLPGGSGAVFCVLYICLYSIAPRIPPALVAGAQAGFVWFVWLVCYVWLVVLLVVFSSSLLVFSSSLSSSLPLALFSSPPLFVCPPLLRSSPLLLFFSCALLLFFLSPALLLFLSCCRLLSLFFSSSVSLFC